MVTEPFEIVANIREYSGDVRGAVEPEFRRPTRDALQVIALKRVRPALYGKMDVLWR